MSAIYSAQTTVLAADFQSSIGVNTHTGSWDAAYGLQDGSGGDVDKVLAELSFLGVHAIRDVLQYSWQLPEYQHLATYGVKFDLFIGASNQADSVAAQVADIANLTLSMLSIEGPNETDNWPIQITGLSGAAATRAVQAQLYADVHGTAALARVQVAETTVGNSESMLAALSGLGNADLGNSHSYFFSYSQTIASQIASRVAQANSIAPGKQVITTEAGWSSAASISDYGSVDQETQAKLTLDMLLDQFQAGIPMTYLYQLNDETELGDSFGLFNQDGTAKPVATALHNLTTILANSDAKATSLIPTKLGYSISGLPATGGSMLMEKSDGVFDLVVWAEPQDWNPTLLSEITVPATAVIINLAAVAQWVKVYDPLLGTTAISTLINTATLQLSVTDHPLIIETDGVPSLPTFGSGRDALVLKINEDAYLGDAMFTVSVDGIQQAGTLTASASRAFQQTQSLTINGNFGPGSHTVYVDFLNDKYDPGIGDRNLYITQATLDGYVISGSTVSLYSNGVNGFTFVGAATFPPTVVLGSGPDVLSLQLAEDAYQGDAQFTISVDGKQVGGMQTATAFKTGGSTQALDVLGNFETGAHTVTVNFFNDAYGGSITTDRNLYVTQASVDNTGISGSSLQEFSSGPQSFSFKAPSPVSGTPNDGTASPTLLTLHLAEDAYQGDAQFIVSIDGTQLGAAQSVSALQRQGAAQAFSFADELSAGTHNVAISFINDLYGGNAIADRNLYVVGADVNATAQNSTAWTTTLFANGAACFNLVVPP